MNTVANQCRTACIIILLKVRWIDFSCLAKEGSSPRTPLPILVRIAAFSAIQLFVVGYVIVVQLLIFMSHTFLFRLGLARSALGLAWYLCLPLRTSKSNGNADNLLIILAPITAAIAFGTQKVGLSMPVRQ
jgi:hypothetical protein